VFLDAWPLIERWAGVDLVLIQTSLLSYVNDALHIVVSRKLRTKSSEVSIKSRSMPASLSFKGQATKQTSTKWSAEKFCLQSLVITSYKL